MTTCVSIHPQYAGYKNALKLTGGRLQWDNSHGLTMEFSSREYRSDKDDGLFEVKTTLNVFNLDANTAALLSAICKMTEEERGKTLSLIDEERE